MCQPPLCVRGVGVCPVWCLLLYAMRTAHSARRPADVSWLLGSTVESRRGTQRSIRTHAIEYRVGVGRGRTGSWLLACTNRWLHRQRCFVLEVVPTRWARSKPKYYRFRPQHVGNGVSAARECSQIRAIKKFVPIAFGELLGESLFHGSTPCYFAHRHSDCGDD